MLEKARWLDPREKAGEAILDSVWIPVSELLNRIFELPSKRELVHIADVGAEAGQALTWLQTNGHLAEVGRDFEYGESGLLRLWSPNAFLEEVLPQIPPGTVLDLACGSGRAAVFMAANGFEVTGLDRLPDALEQGKRLACRYLTDISNLSWVCADLGDYLIDRQFDLVTCFFYLNRELLARLSSLVRPGGEFVMETFTTIHRETFGKPRSERFVLSSGELPNLLPRFEILTYAEGWHGDRHTARVLARRLIV